MTVDPGHFGSSLLSYKYGTLPFPPPRIKDAGIFVLRRVDFLTQVFIPPQIEDLAVGRRRPSLRLVQIP